MLGGLYGDLPAAKGKESTSDVSGWSAASKAILKAAPIIRQKPAAPLAPPASVLRAQALAKPKPVDRRETSPREEPRAEPRMSLAGAEDVVNEYDPLRPNDYEEYRREKEKQMEALAREEARLALERDRERERERRDRERELDRERERDREREADSRGSHSKRDDSLNLSGEEAYLRRGKFSSGPPPGGPSGGFSNSGPLPPPPPLPEDDQAPGLGSGGLTAAQRMMAKMGWKHGEGLGANKQGMSTPLMAKKIDGRSAVIVNAKEQLPEPEPKRPRMAGAGAVGATPTRVLLLRNMVGPGEVDEDLEEEVAEECSKYGDVVRVLIFEVTDPGFPHQEAVRIFVEFTRSESATKGMIDLDGRFFGGRTVHACFFDEDRMERCDLAPNDSEPRA